MGSGGCTGHKFIRGHVEFRGPQRGPRRDDKAAIECMGLDLREEMRVRDACIWEPHPRQNSSCDVAVDETA